MPPLSTFQLSRFWVLGHLPDSTQKLSRKGGRVKFDRVYSSICITVGVLNNLQDTRPTETSERFHAGMLLSGAKLGEGIVTAQPVTINKKGA